MAAGCWGVAAGFGSSSATSKLGNAHVPAGIGVARISSPILGTGITRTGLVTRWPMAVTLTSTDPSASGHRKPRGSSTTCPEASRTTWGRPSGPSPPGRNATKRAIRGSDDVNVMSVGTTVAHDCRKNRHRSISGPEVVLGLAGRSGSPGAGDIRKRRGLGSLAVTKSGNAQPSGIAREP